MWAPFVAENVIFIPGGEEHQLRNDGKRSPDVCLRYPCRSSRNVTMAWLPVKGFEGAKDKDRRSSLVDPRFRGKLKLSNIRRALMRTIVIAVMMVLLWAVPCPAADSGFKQGAREIGRGSRTGQRRSDRGRRRPGQGKWQGRDKGSRSKDQERSQEGLSGDQGGDNGNQAGGPKAGPDHRRVVPGYR